MSDDRADETEDRERRPEGEPNAATPASAAANRSARPPERSTSRLGHPTDRSNTASKDYPTKPRAGVETTSAPARVIRFLREVVAELRKVIWPTRKQLVTYTAVVLVFVSIMVAYVALLDIAFGEVMLYVFG